MTSSWSLRRVKAENGRIDVTDCVGPFYLKITVFIILDSKGIVIFYLGI
jgi:hypothetical protein